MTPSTSQKKKPLPSWSLIRLVSPTGTTKNSPMAKASATTIVPAHMPFPISSSSSSSWALAEMPSALKPICSDSTSATTPRTTGSRSQRCFWRADVSGNDCTPISPRASSGASSGAGLRTPTAQVETPRIITPSRTAWPPTGASRCATSSSLTGLSLRGLGGATLEPIDPATRVDQLLPPGVERVAVRADLDVDLRLGRTRRELVAASAAHVRLDVFRVDLGLHRAVQSSQPLQRAGDRPHVVGLVGLVDGEVGIERDAQRLVAATPRRDEAQHAFVAGGQRLDGLARLGLVGDGEADAERGRRDAA